MATFINFINMATKVACTSTMKKILSIILISSLSIFCFAQNKATLNGKVTDAKTGAPIEFVSVGVSSSGLGTTTDAKGKFSLDLPPNRNLTIEFDYLGYEKVPYTVNLKQGQKQTINVKLKTKVLETGTATVKEDRVRDDVGTLQSISTKVFEYLPSTSGNLDISTFATGVTGSADELSSQYSVRGGSYDENLVYVNDFEIYRPFLIRSGQQEGLTFPNIDLIRSIAFSSGGFQARFGDKLSSVLDVKYKRPDSVRASVGMSFLGGSAHVEGSVKKKKDEKQAFRYLIGARYKTTRYLLGSLQTEGEYVPNFFDLQAYLTYDLSPTWQLGYIGNINTSAYNFVPQERNTTLGLINLALQFRVLFDGQEQDDFNTYMSGVSLSHLPKNGDYYLKFLASTYQSNENERIDISGRYSLGILETNLGEEGAGEEIIAVIGAGEQQQFVRNYLTANMTNVEHKGGWQTTLIGNEKRNMDSHLRWGVKYQREQIVDQINEWERLDSALYTLPYDDDELRLFNVVKSDINLESNRVSGYLQNTFKFIQDTTREMGLTIGVRASYWDLNGNTTITPRAQFYYKPLNGKNNMMIKASVGAYYQPPFYREMRNLEGEINRALLAQKSIHAVLGLVYDFEIYDRPFRFISEAYYKSLWDIVAYDVDNVRIRYYGDNNVKGYATGIDLRLNGEFVPGAESWINLSLLRTREQLDGVTHTMRGVGDTASVVVNDVARPTDQLVSFSMFFQDYLPKNPNFKMNMNFVVGTGLPFGIPQNNVVARNTYRYSPYHRIDIGFSYLLWDEDRRAGNGRSPFKFSRKAWMSFEVFNLLQVANAASNTWVKTTQNQYFAVPNYLTSRRINLRLKMNF